MPWKETSPMDERAKLCFELDDGVDTVVELSRRYGVSRKTLYKWLARYKDEGVDGLRDRSRAPHRREHALSEEVVDLFVAERKRRPSWGPKKLLRVLSLRHPTLVMPARSTVAALLAKRGLVAGSRRPKRAPTYEGPFSTCQAPNELWCADFKGGFRVRDGHRCNPFTLTDAHSRFLIRCEGLGRIHEGAVRPLFESAFREFGLPDAIRTDNGPPFASRSVGGLSKLAIWWVKLGIRPERIEPGKPTQNGRHERMHRTLKQEVVSPTAATMAVQQRRLDAFRKSFNEERPHEALGQDMPAQHYKPSARRYPTKLREPEYNPDIEVRRVRRTGEIKWRGETVYLSETLVGEPVGIEEVTSGRWAVRFGPISLGVLDERGVFHRPGRGRRPWGRGTHQLSPMLMD
jgi:transposase InsO family protein